MKKSLALFFLLLILFINTAPALANICQVTKISGLVAENGEENGKNTVILRWFATVVDNEEGTQNLPGGTEIKIERTQASSTPDGDEGGLVYLEVWSVTPDKASDGIMEWIDTDVIVGTQYYYKVIIPGTALNTQILSQVPDNPGDSDNPGEAEKRNKEYYTIFTPERWDIVMFWYNSMTIISGGFLMAVIVRSGYGYMMAATNPGLKASFIEELQRCIVAMAIIALAPIFITLLISINDGFVAFFANIVNGMTKDTLMVSPSQLNPAGMFETVIAAPFKIIISLINSVFGLNSVDELIFNGQVSLLGTFQNMDTGNVFATALLNLSMVGFDVYFNALYTIRKWVVTVAFTSTPIIVWIWALTAERQVLEIWAAEIFQTVFIQAAHALALGIFLTIMCAKSPGSLIDGSWLTDGLVDIATWVASLGGAVCVLVVVFVGYKIITADGEKEVAEAKSSLKKALIGLSILGLALLIAGFMSGILGGKWY